MAPNRIVELASIIHDNAVKVDAYLTSESLPTPTFDISCPAHPALPPHIQSSQEAVLEATDELTALMLGPVGNVAFKAHNSLLCAQAVQRFGIATSFPPTETSNFAHIAKTCSIPEFDTRRILRHAMTSYIFREPSPGVVAYTASSKALAEIPILRQFVGFLSDEMWPSTARCVDAMQKWPGSEEPNEASFSLANNTDIPMFDAIGRDPKRALQMADAMTFMHAGPSWSPKLLAEHFEWGDAAKGVMVDIGGARGTVSTDIARYLPEIKCIVQDLPEVVQDTEVPDGLKSGERLRFMAHNFFDEQPVKGADVYLLRWILRNLIPALKKGARVVVSDMCLPPPSALSPYKERSARYVCPKERDAEDWQQLFDFADPRFKLQAIKKPTESRLSIIHAVWEGESAF